MHLIYFTDRADYYIMILNSLVYLVSLAAVTELSRQVHCHFYRYTILFYTLYRYSLVLATYLFFYHYFSLGRGGGSLMSRLWILVRKLELKPWSRQMWAWREPTLKGIDSFFSRCSGKEPAIVVTIEPRNGNESTCFFTSSRNLREFKFLAFRRDRLKWSQKPWFKHLSETTVNRHPQPFHMVVLPWHFLFARRVLFSLDSKL